MKMENLRSVLIEMSGQFLAAEFNTRQVPEFNIIKRLNNKHNDLKNINLI